MTIWKAPVKASLVIISAFDSIFTEARTMLPIYSLTSFQHAEHKRENIRVNNSLTETLRYIDIKSLIFVSCGCRLVCVWKQGLCQY